MPVNYAVLKSDHPVTATTQPAVIVGVIASAGKSDLVASQAISSTEGLSTPAQRRLALVICVAMILATLLLLPFSRIPWPNVPAFLPIFQTAAIGTCLITASLMYGNYRATRSTGLLHLSAGYLYTAGILTLQFLSFPGVLLETGRALGGSRTISWLWTFWHIGPALSILYYARSTHQRPGEVTVNHKSALLQTGSALVLALAVTAILVTMLHDNLPVLDVNGRYGGVTAILLIVMGLQLLLVASLALLWRASQFRVVLHMWLAIVVVALLCDNAITIMAGSRLAMGWYVGQLVALIAFSILMLAYLQEIFSCYRRSIELADELASSNSQLGLDIEQRRHYEKKLLDADRQKDEFLVMLAHELRNPLAPISSAADLLARDGLDEKVIKKTSQMLSRQVKQMTSLVNDLMDVSRVTRGLAMLHQANTDAKQILTDAVEQASPLIHAQRHQLDVHWPVEPVLVFADRQRMVQILSNLLNNAAKYTQPGGHIVLQLALRNKQAVFTVTDNGFGMSPELVARAFTLFSQGELNSQRLNGGLGIGLALVKSLVELHGGEVYATSAGPGLGSEFGFELPAVSGPELAMSVEKNDRRPVS